MREIADAAMLRRVDAFEGREVVGQKGNRNCAGMLIPYYFPARPRRTHIVCAATSRPSAGQGWQNKAAAKYLAPLGDGNRLYVPPGVTPAQLQDVTISIVIVEGEKKALALWRLAHPRYGSDSIHPDRDFGRLELSGKIGKTGGPNGSGSMLRDQLPI